MTSSFNSLFSFVDIAPIPHSMKLGDDQEKPQPRRRYKQAQFEENSVRQFCKQLLQEARKEGRTALIEKRRVATTKRQFHENLEDFIDLHGASKHKITNILSPLFDSVKGESIATAILAKIQEVAKKALIHLQNNRNKPDVYLEIKAIFTRNIEKLGQQCVALVASRKKKA